MASVGIRKRVSQRTGQVSYQVWWWLDDGSQGAQTVASKEQARALAAEKRLQFTRDTWQGRRRGRLPFSTWADLWWADWSADPQRSPHTLVMAESRLRNHLRPVFGDRAIDKIGPAELRRRRVRLDRTPPVLQVVDIRYQAGRFGSGFKPRPKSDAGIREIPLAPEVAMAIRRQLPPGTNPADLVFTGPGGGVMARGTRTVLSRHNFRRTYHSALAKLADPPPSTPPWVNSRRPAWSPRAALATKAAGHRSRLPRTRC